MTYTEHTTYEQAWSPTGHFARVAPIIGAGLTRQRIAIIGLPLATTLIEYLAACGLGNWLIGVETSTQAHVAELHQQLHARHGNALQLQLEECTPNRWSAAIVNQPPDLVIAIGGTYHAEAVHAAQAANIPALLIDTTHQQARAILSFPGDPVLLHMPTTTTQPNTDPDTWNWRCAAPLLAGIARAMLLRTSNFARSDLAEIWAQGARILTIGGSHPFDVSWMPPNQPVPLPKALFTSPPSKRGCVLIAGLGSLGSVAAAALAPMVECLVLADPDIVEATNPARQHYRAHDCSKPKVAALREQLAATCEIVTIPEALKDDAHVMTVARRYQVTSGLVVTGTQADFAIARGLRQANIPHVVARCYPRARYWEAILVDGQRGPSLADIRGHLQLGPVPTPTPEQRAAYSDLGTLEAEPATLIESGWAALWAARLVDQLQLPRGLRERWLLDLLALEQTCLVGGAYTEHTNDGPAYAIAQPGQIWAWGKATIRR